MAVTVIVPDVSNYRSCGRPYMAALPPVLAVRGLDDVGRAGPEECRKHHDSPDEVERTFAGLKTIEGRNRER